MVVLSTTAALGYAQDVTTVDATSEDISQNLDLEAVASIFGESKDLEDFEQKLNDPEDQISNLDLNEDGYVDYLRVVETSENDVHLIAIQSVLGEDIYQDVATVLVEKDEGSTTSVRVVGDVYLYGPSYVITPVYVRPPLIFGWFWGPRYRPYRSVYYWGYYPRYYRIWRPFPITRYRTNVALHININNTYRYTTITYSARVNRLHTTIRRNDFAVKYPSRSYTARSVTRTNVNGTQKRTVAVHQADGDTYRKAGVNKADGTKKRAAGVNKADGTKKRVAGVNQADGDKYRTAGVQNSDGTTKRVAGVNKADGTKKRAATVKSSDGSRKTVAVKKNPDGSKRAVSVKKDSDGSRTVRTAGKTSNSKSKRTKTKSTSSRKKTVKRKKN
ncbi:MAG: hypothetical protein ED555_11420 [Allomuricauda sp.]|nr:MAG: hypothetical protein ED555_11420 [Allomuricauda sp.]